MPVHGGRRLTKEEVMSAIRGRAQGLHYPINNIQQLEEQVRDISIGGKTASISDLRRYISFGDFPVNNMNDLVTKADRLFDRLKADNFHGSSSQR